MLCLSRFAGESIDIGDGVRVIVRKIRGSKVLLAIDAPDDVKIMRSEMRGRPSIEEARLLAEQAAEQAEIEQARREAESREEAEWAAWAAKEVSLA